MKQSPPVPYIISEIQLFCEGHRDLLNNRVTKKPRNTAGKDKTVKIFNLKLDSQSLNILEFCSIKLTIFFN